LRGDNEKETAVQAQQRKQVSAPHSVEGRELRGRNKEENYERNKKEAKARNAAPHKTS
jgi:hypothetical protein